MNITDFLLTAIKNRQINVVEALAISGALKYVKIMLSTTGDANKGHRELFIEKCGTESVDIILGLSFKSDNK